MPRLPTVETENGPGPARTVLRVGLETASVLLAVSLPLGAFLIVDRSSATGLLSTCVSWKVAQTAEAPDLPPDLFRVPEGSSVEILESDDGVWLRACAPPEVRREVLRKLGETGIWRRGELRTEPRWAVELGRFLSEPSAWTALHLPWQLWLVSAAPVGFLFAGLWLARRREIQLRPPPEIGWLSRLGWGLGLALIGWAGAWTLEHLLPGMEEQPLVRALAEASGPSALLLMGTAVVLAPLGEEVFFRGYVFRHLRGTVGRGSAYGVSALLFAAVHAHLPATLAYVLYGLLFAWGYERTRSLAVPVTAHAAVNAVAVASLLSG